LSDEEGKKVQGAKARPPSEPGERPTLVEVKQKPPEERAAVTKKKGDDAAVAREETGQET
jgi:hypothetical protein